jgi:hypothetical protein
MDSFEILDLDLDHDHSPNRSSARRARTVTTQPIILPTQEASLSDGEKDQDQEYDQDQETRLGDGQSLPGSAAKSTKSGLEGFSPWEEKAGVKADVPPTSEIQDE